MTTLTRLLILISLTAFAACTYQSSGFSSTTCDTEGERSGLRVCRSGYWVETDELVDLDAGDEEVWATPDTAWIPDVNDPVPDSGPSPDVHNPAPDIIEDVVEPDASEPDTSEPDTSEPDAGEPDADICVPDCDDRCGVADGCAGQCPEECPGELICNEAGRCVTCEAETDAELCGGEGVLCGDNMLRDRCGDERIVNCHRDTCSGANGTCRLVSGSYCCANPGGNCQ